jgi:hypothetical protein
MKDDDITAATGAAFLNSFSKILNQWSMLFALAAILILGLKHYNHFLAISLIVALFQAYIAARCAFDAAIFNALTGDETNYQIFDHVLTHWQLRKASNSTQRVQGALGLLRQQALSFVMQTVLLLIGLS